MNSARVFFVSAALLLSACSNAGDTQGTAPRAATSTIAPGAANAESAGAEPVPMTWAASGAKRERRKVILQRPQRPADGTGM